MSLKKFKGKALLIYWSQNYWGGSLAAVGGALVFDSLLELEGGTLVENGTKDEIFPIQHVKKTVGKARRAWEVFGAGGALATDYFEGRHAIGGAKAYDFLAKHLGAS